MRKYILASHGKLSEGMVDSVHMIMGDIQNLSWVSLSFGEHPDKIRYALEKDILQHPQDEYIIISDIAGGSVNTALLQLLKIKNVHVIAGMHLGMILALCTSEDADTSLMINQVLKETKANIIYANDLLKMTHGKKG